MKQAHMWADAAVVAWADTADGLVHDFDKPSVDVVFVAPPPVNASDILYHIGEA